MYTSYFCIHFWWFIACSILVVESVVGWVTKHTWKSHNMHRGEVNDMLISMALIVKMYASIKIFLRRNSIKGWGTFYYKRNPILKTIFRCRKFSGKLVMRNLERKRAKKSLREFKREWKKFWEWCWEKRAQIRNI